MPRMPFLVALLFASGSAVPPARIAGSIDAPMELTADIYVERRDDRPRPSEMTARVEQLSAATVAASSPSAGELASPPGTPSPCDATTALRAFQKQTQL